ncbi:3-oxo-5-alpha-steroid 4-dehydrogenase 1-like isoform X1 [Artemia franciscana]|uniref:3-oxo-5alpha-steroid 4-dehydrogenase (NADP(+)) n=1 Tax=Artemia franciscana TaxID=6661 RepID=A0AA88HQA5_ARTSF|nr:hypothetical protein QYM36_013516 [Artemia franciscana]
MIINTFFNPDEVIQYFLSPLFLASSLTELIYNMLIFKVIYTIIVFVAMLLMPAPYGRFTSRKYGFMISAKIAWMVQESPGFLVPLWLILFSSAEAWRSSITNKILISYVLVHYFQRSFIYPALIRGGKPTPFVSFLNAVGICGLNGLMQGLYLVNHTIYSSKWLLDPRFLLGSLLFFGGMAINIHSDSILRKLRKPGQSGYKVPYGGAFKFVTAANYFGEALEWNGFAIATWSPTALVFAVFATLFLALRSERYQRFYKEKFEDYPKDRKIFLPFVW